MRTRWQAHALLALLIVAVASCEAAADPASTSPDVATIEPEAGRGASDAPGGTDADAGDVDVAPLPPACDLLATDEIATAVGNPVEPGDDVLESCFWSASEDPGTGVTLGTSPMLQADCVDFNEAVALVDEFASHQSGELGVPAFWIYNETLAETHVGGFDVCTPAHQVSLRVEGPAGAEPDEASHRAMAEELTLLVLERLDIVAP